MDKVAQKKNLSSIQVLKTLKVLMQGDYTMNELISILNDNETDSEVIFNNSVISKYINTCRYCGMTIPKIHNKYYVTSMPFGLDLSTNETDIFNRIQITVKEHMSKRVCKIFDRFLDKLNRYSNKEIIKIDKEDYIFSVETFERAVTQKRKIKLLFKNRTELICTPLKVINSKGKIFFKIHNKRDRFIDISRLSGVETLSDKFVHEYSYEQTVVFVLKGDLAKRYVPHENESVLYTKKDGTVTITNRGEKKEALFSRLLRYDSNCEITNPKSYREEMKHLLDETLKNYGV